MKKWQKLKVTVLDETVPYPSEEEIQTEIEEKKWLEEMEAQAGNTIPAEGVRSIGEEIKNPFRDENSTEFEDIRFTVKDIKFRIRCRSISFQEKTMPSMKMRLLCG